MPVKRRTAEEWRGLVNAWSMSGLSRDEFARARGIRPVTLGWWRWKLGLESTGASPEAMHPAFVDVVVAEPIGTAPDFLVELGNVRVRVSIGFDAGELRRLVDALC